MKYTEFTGKIRYSLSHPEPRGSGHDAACRDYSITIRAERICSAGRKTSLTEKRHGTANITCRLDGWLRFHARELTIKIGDTVEWTNGADPDWHSATHTPDAGGKVIFDSPDIFAGDPAFSYTFNCGRNIQL